MYYRFVCTFEEQVQYLIEKAQKDFVIFLLIDYSVITDSIDFLLTDPALHAWIKSWSTHVKDQLKYFAKHAGTPSPIPRRLPPLKPSLMLSASRSRCSWKKRRTS